MAMASLLYPDEEQAQIQAPQGGPLSLLQPPDDRPPALQPDPRADALGTVYQQVMDAMEAQRRISAARGLWDDNTGLPTKAGLLDAIGQAGTAVALGTGGAPERPGFTAYHGSPHQFDAFDLSKIGTGEGAQAYGHGMYLAENEGVARSYKMAGQPGGVGHMYEVNVNADPERFLHWDKPLNEQHPDVQAAFGESGPLSEVGKYFANNPRLATNGAAIEDTLKMMGHTSASAAQALNDAGIPGIRYLDQGSRGAGEGSHNYVVFDANTMNIIRRYGLAGLMAGGGAAAMGGRQRQQQ
jgi:hypothetical protein